MNYLIVTNDPISAKQEALEQAKSYNPSDVFWIKKNPDKKEITVDVINDMINQFNLSAVADKKLFIVFQAELMNTSKAANPEKYKQLSRFERLELSTS